MDPDLAPAGGRRWWVPFALLPVNLAYLVLLTLESLLFALLVPLPLLLWFKLRGAPAAQALRVNNWLYGRAVVAGLWPLVRVGRIGRARAARRGPCVFIVNHRSFTDIFFCALIPHPRMICIVRSWPFRVLPFGWFMHAAQYIDIERDGLAGLLGEEGRRRVAEGCSFLFFPEGHRSRTGRLQRLRAGAFTLAAAHNLRVAPVCLRGTERLAWPGWPLLRPGRVTLEFLEPIDPAAFPAEDRARALRAAAEDAFRQTLGEQAA